MKARMIVRDLALGAVLLSSVSQVTSGGYDYPIKLGTPEYINLPDMDARWRACDIPANVLDKMSDRDLVDAFIEYPFRGDVLASSTSVDHGFEMILRRFSGGRELLKRQGCAELLVGKYESICAAAEEALEPVDLFLSAYITAALKRDEILNHLSPDERRALVRAALRHFRIETDALKDQPARLAAKVIICYQANPDGTDSIPELLRTPDAKAFISPTSNFRLEDPMRAIAKLAEEFKESDVR